MSNKRSYSLRALILFIVLVAVALGLWRRKCDLHNLATRHHMAAMDFGYQAAAIQRPVDLQWEWKDPAPLRFDRATVVEASTCWQQSMQHARLRDLYLAASQRPWMPLKSMPERPDPAAPLMNSCARFSTSCFRSVPNLRRPIPSGTI